MHTHSYMEFILHEITSIKTVIVDTSLERVSS